ncbi:signal peptide peptidase SppA [Halomonas cibimaris]|uniref:Signal peptide peptidase SppA n=1 Tax=Halomonas cibimaris TaxID=657012 RepID=A0ABP7LND7_9GAMM
MSDEPTGSGGEQGGRTARRDPWTDSDAASAEPPGGAGYPEDDTDTLRERQRLQQMAMMDRWIGGVLIEQRRSRRWKIFFRLLLATLLLMSVLLSAYSLFGGQPASAVSAQPHLGVVAVEGPIASDAPANAERLIRGLNRAWQAQSAKAVVLHINSPGGSPVQSQRIYAEVMRLRQAGDKPIIAVIEDIGASGAYYIAAAADEVVASPASLVGSIGVIYSSFGAQQAINKLGIERRVMTAGENKAFLDPFQPLNEDTQAFWQTVLDTTHQQFVADVKAGRGARLADDPRLFSGLVWSGEQAIELGLVDRLASIEDVAREYTGGMRRQDYTPALGPLDRLTRRFARTAAQALGLSVSPSPLHFTAER